MSARNALRSLRSDESGSMLVELVIAMTFIVVAVGALMSSYASSMVSLHRSGTEGTALTLADRQIEAYKSLPYDSIQLASSTIPSGSDPYVTAHSSDATIPSSTGQITGGTPAASCTDIDPGCRRVRHADLDGARRPAVPGGHLHRLDDPNRRADHQAGNGRRAPDDQRLAGLQDLEPRNVRVRSVEPAAVTRSLPRTGKTGRFGKPVLEPCAGRRHITSRQRALVDQGRRSASSSSDNHAGRTVRIWPQLLTLSRRGRERRGGIYDEPKPSRATIPPPVARIVGFELAGAGESEPSNIGPVGATSFSSSSPSCGCRPAAP